MLFSVLNIVTLSKAGEKEIDQRNRVTAYITIKKRRSVNIN